MLDQQLEIAKAERDTATNKFQGMIYGVQAKSGLKNLVLEKKLQNMQVGRPPSSDFLANSTVSGFT